MNIMFTHTVYEATLHATNLIYFSLFTFVVYAAWLLLLFGRRGWMLGTRERERERDYPCNALETSPPCIIPSFVFIGFWNRPLALFMT